MSATEARAGTTADRRVRRLKGVGRSLTPQQKLACLLRIAASEGWSENLAGHITVVRDDTDTMWVNPWGIWWEEVRASDIVLADADGNVLEGRWDVTAAINIHTELHRQRPDAKVLVHNHPYYATLLGIVGEMPRLLHQNFAAFAGEMRLVDEYTGTINNVDEGRWLADQAGDASVVLLRNHGVVLTAPTIEEAAWKCAMFERMCRMTWDLLQSGREGRELDDAQLPALKQQLLEACPQPYWDGACRQLVEAEPDVLS